MTIEQHIDDGTKLNNVTKLPAQKAPEHIYQQ